jgi:hypothetical protein
MTGLHRTEALKFDHPGLATTAVRGGETLLIQNDIGETDAHVLVVHVTGLTVTLTYSDCTPSDCLGMSVRRAPRRTPCRWRSHDASFSHWHA